MEKRIQKLGFFKKKVHTHKVIVKLEHTHTQLSNQIYANFSPQLLYGMKGKTNDVRDAVEAQISKAPKFSELFSRLPSPAKSEQHTHIHKQTFLFFFS